MKKDTSLHIRKLITYYEMHAKFERKLLIQDEFPSLTDFFKDPKRSTKKFKTLVKSLVSTNDKNIIRLIIAPHEISKLNAILLELGLTHRVEYNVQYNKKHDSALIRAAIIPPDYSSPEPESWPEYTSREEADKNRDMLQLEHPDKLIVMRSFRSFTPHGWSYRVEVWEPIDFLKYEFPTISPAELIHGLVLSTYEADRTAFLLMKRQSMGTKAMTAKGQKTRDSIRLEYMKLREAHKDKSKKWIQRHIALNHKHARGYSLRNIKKYTADL